MATVDILTHDTALAFLMGRINYERTSRVPYGSTTFRLRRMCDLLQRLGNPHEQLNIVHVAGTKGKGSTATMVAAMLKAAGYHTGLYTSPHLERLEERANVDGAACTEDELIDRVGDLKPVVEAMDREAQLTGERGPTFFEVTTALALLHFARRQVDAAVLEVGLGGRLDSTNVCRPLVSVITSISFDHTAILGNSLARIAREKAGIIKRNTPVVSGVTAPEARAVIEQVAKQRHCRLLQMGKEFDFDYQPPRHLSHVTQASESSRCGMLRFRAPGLLPYEIADDVPLALLGRHQAANAAVAIAVAAQLAEQGWRISEQAIRAGLAGVRCPARIELISRRPTVVIDAAHNVASVEALIQTLDESVSDARRRILIFATSKDKDAEGMLNRLVPYFHEIILTRYVKNPRYVNPQRLCQMVRELSGGSGNGAPPKEPVICADPQTAWLRAQTSAVEDDLICVAGSAFLAAEIRALLRTEAN